MQVTVVGLDISKQVFQLQGVSAEGQVGLRKRLRRLQGAAFLAHLPPGLMGIEAGTGAHDWARVLPQYGQEVKLISPQYGKPYGKGTKNDAHDAAAMCEAVSPTDSALCGGEERGAAGFADAPPGPGAVYQSTDSLGQSDPGAAE